MTTGFSGASDLNGPIAPGRGLADAIDDVHALDHLAEHGVAPAGGHRVEVRVVGDVHVELRVARVRLLAAGQADRAALVLQAVAGLVDDVLVGGLELQVVAS